MSGTVQVRRLHEARRGLTARITALVAERIDLDEAGSAWPWLARVRTRIWLLSGCST